MLYNSILYLFFRVPFASCLFLHFLDLLPAVGLCLVLDEDLVRGRGEIDAKLKQGGSRRQRWKRWKMKTEPRKKSNNQKEKSKNLAICKSSKGGSL